MQNSKDHIIYGSIAVSLIMAGLEIASQNIAMQPIPAGRIDYLFSNVKAITGAVIGSITGLLPDIFGPAADLMAPAEKI